MALVLRPYQNKALDGLRDGWHRGVRRQLLSAPTGAGKTEMALALIRAALDRGSRCLFLVESTALLKQASQRFYDNEIEHGLIGAGMTRNTGARLLIAMQQSLELMESWPDADLIIVDEAHVQRRKTTEFLRNTKATVIGLSATGFSKGMGDTYGNVVNTATTVELIRQGFLVPPKVYCATEVNMTGARTSNGEWSDKEVEARAIPIIGDIVSEWVEHTNRIFGGPVKTLCFSPTIAFGSMLARQFQESGYRFEQVSAKKGPKPKDGFYEPDLDWTEKIDAFREGKIIGLISVDKLAKGFDDPDVLCGISARPYRRSLAGHIQQIGRVMRPAPGKKFALWLDHAGNWRRLLEPTEHFWRHGLDSLEPGKLKQYHQAPKKEPKDIACTGCKLALPKGADICPMCGTARPVRKPNTATKPGRMEEYRTIQDQVGDLWPHICRNAADRHPKDANKALRFAKAQYHEMTGGWPNQRFSPCAECDPRVSYAIDDAIRRYINRQKRKRRKAA